MSKRYKGKTCAYCSTPHASETADHVVAREFFLVEKRVDLPKVAACKTCNVEKSKLEHYLTAVLPFGGQHNDAGENLSTMVEPRLAKNKKLAETLAKGRRLVLYSRNGSPWTVRMTLPFDGERASELFRLITKGLAHWHWKLDLPDRDCIVLASFLRHAGEAMFQRLLAMNVRDRVAGNFGDGTFVYEGAQAVDDYRLTVWRMSLYGVVVGDGSRTPAKQAIVVYAITAPKRMAAASSLARMLGGIR